MTAKYLRTGAITGMNYGAHITFPTRLLAYTEGGLSKNELLSRQNGFLLSETFDEQRIVGFVRY